MSYGSEVLTLCTENKLWFTVYITYLRELFCTMHQGYSGYYNLVIDTSREKLGSSIPSYTRSCSGPPGCVSPVRAETSLGVVSVVEWLDPATGVQKRMDLKNRRSTQNCIYQPRSMSVQLASKLWRPLYWGYAYFRKYLSKFMTICLFQESMIRLDLFKHTCWS